MKTANQCRERASELLEEALKTRRKRKRKVYVEVASWYSTMAHDMDKKTR